MDRFSRNGFFLKQTLWTGLFLMNGLFKIGTMGSLKSVLWTGFQGTVFFEIATMDWSFSKERLFEANILDRFLSTYRLFLKSALWIRFSLKIDFRNRHPG